MLFSCLYYSNVFLILANAVYDGDKESEGEDDSLNPEDSRKVRKNNALDVKDKAKGQRFFSVLITIFLNGYKCVSHFVSQAVC